MAKSPRRLQTEAPVTHRFMVIRLADKQQVAVFTGSAEAESNHGGYVHDVEAGLHPWIAILTQEHVPSIMSVKHRYTTR